MTEQTITLDEALKLLSLPREVGVHPDDGQPIVTNFGRFGPYVKHNDEFRSLESDDEVFDISSGAGAGAAARAEAVAPPSGHSEEDVEGADPQRHDDQAARRSVRSRM